MQTNLAPPFNATPAGQEADAILRTCVHCGFCTATCPTYQLLGDELDGPRGRIYLIKELLEGRAKDLNVAIEMKFDPQLKPMQADPEGLHKALLNIVSNALDALQETPDARVTLSTTLETNGRWAQMTVQDNGPGIPTDIQQNIFKPFVSTKGSKGTGLGLAVCRKILREHGGDVILHSEPGHGAKFVLRLPLPASDAAGQRRTMLVDDSPAGA